MTDNSLAHFGVKGMKWGQRKDGTTGEGRFAKAKAKAAAVKADRAAAKEELPQRNAELKAALKARKLTKRGTPERKAAEDAIDKADDAWVETYYRSKARTTGENIASVVGFAAVVAGPTLVLAGAQGLAGAAANRAAARGAQAAADILADSRGLTSYRTIALAFDAASGTWK